MRARRSGTTYLHRMIAERVIGSIPSGMVIDHINRDRLDNRRSNLRLVDRSQHAVNRAVTNQTGYRWVHRTGSTFRADVKWRGQRVRKGGFRTAQEAHDWAKQQATQMHGGDAFIE